MGKIFIDNFDKKSIYNQFSYCGYQQEFNDLKEIKSYYKSIKKHPWIFLNTVKEERSVFIVVMEIIYLGLIAIAGVCCLEGEIVLTNSAMIIPILIELGIRFFPLLKCLPDFGKYLFKLKEVIEKEEGQELVETLGEKHIKDDYLEETKKDAYADNIQDLIHDCVDLKYFGYEKDVKLLYKTLRKYYMVQKDCLKNKKSFILTSEWVKPLATVQLHVNDALKEQKENTAYDERLANLRTFIEANLGSEALEDEQTLTR